MPFFVYNIVLEVKDFLVSGKLALILLKCRGLNRVPVQKLVNIERRLLSKQQVMLSGDLLSLASEGFEGLISLRIS